MSLSTFFSTIETDVTGFFAKLPSEEQALISDLKPILTGAYGEFISAMLPATLSIITDLATTGKTSNEKRDAAVSQVEAAATTAGLAVLSGAANLVVEAAYSKLQASGLLPSPTSTPAVAATPQAAPVNPTVPAEVGATASAPAPSVG